MTMSDTGRSANHHKLRMRERAQHTGQFEHRESGEVQAEQVQTGQMHAGQRHAKQPTAEKGRRYQWGAETSTQPLAIMHSKPTARRIITGYVAIAVTCIAWLVYVITMVLTLFVYNPHITLRFVIEGVLYLSIVTTLIFSALVYLITRQGALYRFIRHERVPRAMLDAHFAHDYQHGITVLIPSYVEQPKVVEKTVWSALLQEFPDIAVVLLIDDPPRPKNQESADILAACRALMPRVLKELAQPAQQFTQARDRAIKQLQGSMIVRRSIIAQCAQDYRAAARWLEYKADTWVVEDHTDAFFTNHVLRDLARDLRQTEQALNQATELSTMQTQSATMLDLTPERIIELYNRLVRIFSASGWSFERKMYASTSQEGNKAMNLNSFIGLMGHKVKRVTTADGVILRDTTEGEVPDMVIRDSTYVLTLDADSMLLREYCLRLVYQLEQPGNERVAVIQTPYSSYRGAPTRIERIAAATTDIQHVLHQGMTYYDATFWVGANAVIRKQALDDICVVSSEGTRTIRTYIQDRTVIEDTESSIDLGRFNWHLVNYPERLSYSATPPDFGSLVVQRRRWANGGLLIIGKFFRTVRARKRVGRDVSLGEWMLRVNYMASIAWSSIGLLLLLAYPFDQRLLSPWVVLASFPYFATMASDLHQNGYKRTDIFRIYGFNIVLLTVNLVGTLTSIRQGMTNTKIPFARTPKVRDRTASPGLYVTMPWVIIIYSSLVLYADTLSHNWGNAIFAGFNAVVTLWALIAYIGIWHSIEDMVLGLIGWFFVPIEPERAGTMGTRSVQGAQGVTSATGVLYARKRLRGARRYVKRVEQLSESAATRSWQETLYYGDQDTIYESR